MQQLPGSLKHHRIQTSAASSVTVGKVRFAPAKSAWFWLMALGALIGGPLTFSWTAFALFLALTGSVLLFGHSLGSHRKLIHDSFQCSRWLERWLVWMGVQVGLAGPIGLLRQHELRDYAQRLPDCHPYLRHGSAPLKDAWWQLNCELELENPPSLAIEARIASDRFYQWLERTWMLQQLPPALVLFVWGGWGFVFWGVCARVTAGVFGHWLIGYFAHNHGGMHFHVEGAAVQGRNIRWTSLLTMGECWHNNHHAYPGSARLGLGAGEWDPGWWALMVLHRMGWAWSFRLPDDLPPRPELHAVNDAFLCRETPVPVPSVAWLWEQARSPGGGRTKLCSPGAHMSRRGLRRLLGARARISIDPRLPRLTVIAGERKVTGLPALWLAAARGSSVLRMAMAPLLPPAVAAERLRTYVSLEPTRP